MGLLNQWIAPTALWLYLRRCSVCPVPGSSLQDRRLHACHLVSSSVTTATLVDHKCILYSCRHAESRRWISTYQLRQTALTLDQRRHFKYDSRHLGLFLHEKFLFPVTNRLIIAPGCGHPGRPVRHAMACRPYCRTTKCVVLTNSGLIRCRVIRFCLSPYQNACPLSPSLRSCMHSFPITVPGSAS